MRGVKTYFMAFRTLPSGLAAAIIPLLTVPVFQLLGALNAEINGSTVSGSVNSQLSVLGSVVLLSSAWIAGISLNHYDLETNKLIMHRRIVSAFVTHLLLAVTWLTGTLILLAVFNIVAFKELSGWSVGIVALEVTLLSLLGCTIGFAFKSGVFSVSFIILYSLLLAPAVERLLPALTMRGITPRLSEVTNGQHIMFPLLFDVAYLVALIVSFLGLYLLSDKLCLRNKNGHQTKR